VVHSDETSWREDGQNGYVWCLATGGAQPIRYYEYDRSRAGSETRLGLASLFGTWQARNLNPFHEFLSLLIQPMSVSPQDSFLLR